MIRPTQVPMREQDPKVRIRNFEEVPFGYTPEEAVSEAERCLQCKRAPCIQGCPVNINIPQIHPGNPGGRLPRGHPHDQGNQ
jgi:glutamate synthase (NADPH/NADH) small chain